jgi:C-terminal processing protease CtpA/Prc
MKILRLTYIANLFFVLICLFSAVQNAQAQNLDRVEKGRMKDILNTIKGEIKKNYYDANFRGIDIDARFKKAEEKLDQASSIGQSYAIIAQVLIDFEDSHLFFSPPATNLRFEYGFRMKMVGDRAYITSVKPKSDADKKGLKAGDRILSIEGFRPNRKEFWKIGYYYYALSPRPKLRFSILHAAAEEAQNIEIEAKVTPLKAVVNFDNTQDVNDMMRETDDWLTRKSNYYRNVGDTVIWKMKTFAFEPAEVDEIMQSKGKRAGNLIIDLRENGGGYVKTLEQLVGYIFDKDMKIADRKGREEKKKENKPMLSKTKGKDVFKGKLIVLIDSPSASASEIFARLIQLEKRGIILGDVSAGAVMQSISYPLKLNSGDNREIWYAASITNADVIMSDGKSVEHVGVIPDERIIPSAEDLAAQRDPVLARAVELLGGKITAEEAGKFFPYDWDNE